MERPAPIGKKPENVQRTKKGKGERGMPAPGAARRPAFRAGWAEGARRAPAAPAPTKPRPGSFDLVYRPQLQLPGQLRATESKHKIGAGRHFFKKQAHKSGQADRRIILPVARRAAGPRSTRRATTAARMQITRTRAPAGSTCVSRRSPPPPSRRESTI